MFRISHIKAKSAIFPKREARFEDKPSFPILVPKELGHKLNDLDQKPHAISLPVDFKWENYDVDGDTDTDEYRITSEKPQFRQSTKSELGNQGNINLKNQMMYKGQKSDHGDGVGIKGLMKSFAGKKLLRSWEEDLDSTISVYETMENMSQVTSADKLKVVLIMLFENALLYYLSHVLGIPTYEEALNVLRQCYNNSDKRSGILTKWKSLRLPDEFASSPEFSVGAVFRKFVAKLTSLQKQLDFGYHDDKFLKNWLITAVDFPSI